VVLANAPDTTKVKAVWYTVDAAGAATKLVENEIVGSASPINFKASNSAGPWPSGNYRVEIYLNDKLNNTLDFAVQ
jgi:outer membrane usher protein FimD/PapC